MRYGYREDEQEEADTYRPLRYRHSKLNKGPCVISVGAGIWIPRRRHIHGSDLNIGESMSDEIMRRRWRSNTIAGEETVLTIISVKPLLLRLL